jgi:serine/threonine protein kinase
VLSEGPEELWLLSELMPGGNMADWLRGRKASAVVGATAGAASSSSSRPPPLAERVAAALDVARALAALAGARPLPIMHRDVKPSNVFIDAGGRARLGDFGLARPYCSDGVEDDDKEEEGDKTTTTTAAASAFRAAAMTDLTGETGTYAYMAPEVIRHEAYDGAKADAWAFGIFLVECCTLERPYEAERLLPVQIALAVADEKLKPWIPAQLLPPSVAVLAAALCDFDPAMRPDWAFVIGELEQTVGELRGERPARGGGDGTAGEAPSSSWLLSRLLSSELVPSSWIPVLGAAAVTADGGGGGTGGGGGSGGGAGEGAGGAVGTAASS